MEASFCKLEHFKLTMYIVSKKLAIFISVITLMFAVFTATPQFRNKIRDYLMPSSRQVLATASGDFRGDGQDMFLIKIKENHQVYLEFYVKSKESLKFTQRLILAGPLDGYFTFQGEATNLAITNLDPDSPLEIFAPSFDEEFIAHLQIVKFSTLLQKFDFLSEDEIPQIWKQ
jgi:hypothetical protein